MALDGPGVSTLQSGMNQVLGFLQHWPAWSPEDFSGKLEAQVSILAGAFHYANSSFAGNSQWIEMA